MKGRYVVLFCVAIAATALASALARNRAPSAQPEPVAITAARAVAVEIHDDRVIANPASVTVGERLALSIVNHSRHAAQLALAGYEGRLDVPLLAPDSTWHGELIADRPGEQLAWLVDGTPRGRFDVTGSHLEEGHR
jgi:hypothetical protein